MPAITLPAMLTPVRVDDAADCMLPPATLLVTWTATTMENMVDTIT